MSSSSAPTNMPIVSLTFIISTLLALLCFLKVPPTTVAAAAYAGSFELPQPAGTLNGRRQPSPPALQLSPSQNTDAIECTNASLKADFGTACLKKAITSGPFQKKGISPSKSKAPTPGRSRYFAVKPMMIQQQTSAKSFGVKSPALSARELYASKGYQPFPVKSVRTVSGGSLNMLPAGLPANKFYRVGVDKSAEQTPSTLPLTPIDPTAIVAEDDEWRDSTLEKIIPPLTAEKNAFKPPSSLGVHPAQQQHQGQYSEELEMLRSLKRSLGVLSAQALNLKQRSALLYREARRRKLYFFDALLSRTHSFLTEKTDETRNALSDIDTAIQQIEVHHREAAALEALRRSFYFYQQDYLPTSASASTRSLNSFTSRRMRKRNTSKIDPREVDQLILDALNHAKRMMSIVRELNEAMDEFEEQFNLPRYEPNRVLTEDNNSVDGANNGEVF